MPERVEDLGLSGLRLIQDPDGFCFGTDAVCLSRFVSVKLGERLIDLCTGNGVLPILLSACTRCADMTAVELQPRPAALARRNVALNGLEGRIKIIEGDIRELPKQLGDNGFHVVTCNPPYLPAGTGKQNALDERTIARHEITCTLSDVVSVSAHLLRPGGRLYLVHRPERLIDLCCVMRAHKLEPKRMQFVCHAPGEAPCLVLVEGQLCRRPGLSILPPMVVTEG